MSSQESLIIPFTTPQKLSRFVYTAKCSHYQPLSSSAWPFKFHVLNGFIFVVCFYAHLTSAWRQTVSLSALLMNQPLLFVGFKFKCLTVLEHSTFCEYIFSGALATPTLGHKLNQGEYFL